jgi:hypothetical protein
MSVTELDTFVRKFHQLWNDGLTAHLDLDTHAGNAWVGLRVQLGQVPGPPHQQVQPFPHQVLRKVESPSRQRRRTRRAAGRAANTINNEAVEANIVVKEKETTEDVVENMKDFVDNDGAVEATFDEKVGDMAEEATSDRSKTTEKVVDDIVDEFCSDKEYQVESDCVIYTFVSAYAKEDIIDTLNEELFLQKNATLVSNVALRPVQSADQQCIVVIRKVTGHDVSWPVMNSEQSAVFKELRLRK